MVCPALLVGEVFSVVYGVGFVCGFEGGFVSLLEVIPAIHLVCAGLVISGCKIRSWLTGWFVLV